AEAIEPWTLPAEPAEFQEFVRVNFLDGFPRDFFRKPWKPGLDTADQLEVLRAVMRTTWDAYVNDADEDDKATKGPPYPYWSNAQIFTASKGGDGGPRKKPRG